MPATRFSLGIDLGTSNSAMTLSAVSDSGEQSFLETLDITQVIGPYSIGERKTMPSALYLPLPGEFSPDAVSFRSSDFQPDSPEGRGEAVIGHFAREHGATQPDRLVVSAKSWLCARHSNPRERILPWASPSVDKANRLSPFEATRAYLQHMRDSFQMQAKGASVAETHLTLTVPASFDEVARQLTAEAAESLGFAGVSLMEEPQAAFYSWLQEQGSHWRQAVRPGDLLFVCDIGGGTTDFSLIAVSDHSGNLELERVSVGEHILLGGDNIDLALAYALRQQIEDEGNSLDDIQFLSLVHQCRRAKETLLMDDTLPEMAVSVASRGAGLFSGSLTTRLQRATLDALIFDGFLPLTDPSDLPAARTGSGLKEFGLSYEHDPVVSKHIAAFLTRSRDVAASHTSLASRLPSGALLGRFLKPTAVLFNGGFFKPSCVRRRVLELLARWSPEAPPRELAGSNYDLAVARGACSYGIHKLTGRGVRIRAGAARSYYIGLETTMLAVPGIRPAVKAVCVVPQGMEEGTEAVLSNQQFGLILGQEVRFRFFSSVSRSGEKTGAVIPNAEKMLVETAALTTTFAPLAGMKSGEMLPVRLHCRVSEMGTLELWMQHVENPENQWKLEFSVRTV